MVHILLSEIKRTVGQNCEARKHIYVKLVLTSIKYDYFQKVHILS